MWNKQTWAFSQKINVPKKNQCKKQQQDNKINKQTDEGTQAPKEKKKKNRKKIYFYCVASSKSWAKEYEIKIKDKTSKVFISVFFFTRIFFKKQKRITRT